MLKLNRNLILGSGSPRRCQILADCGFEFTVKVIPTDESYSDSIPVWDVPAYLAKNKAAVFTGLGPQDILLCADTVVIVNDGILTKPSNESEAIEMLNKLSNTTHTVVTACCLKTISSELIFNDAAKVTFKPLSSLEISYYIETCNPFDKAGSYGVQDFIGMAGIEKIEGSFYTIMGLPIHMVYAHLQPYLL